MQPWYHGFTQFAGRLERRSWCSPQNRDTTVLRPYRAWLWPTNIAGDLFLTMPRVSGQSRTRRDRADSDNAVRATTSADPVKAQTVRLPASLWRQLKIRAVDEERPMSEIIRDALQAYLSAKRPDST